MKLLRNSNLLFFFVLILGLLIIFRGILLESKILFPSNFLVFFYSPWVTDHIQTPHKPIGDDQIRIFFPDRVFTNTLLKQKELPLWNPHVFAGTPHIANFQSAVFYPFNALYLFLPMLPVWQFLLIVQPILASFFMFLLLRTYKLSKEAVWMGSLAYGFSGFMLVWSQENVVVGQAALWLPLTLFGIESFLTSKKPVFFIVAVLAHTCSILAGFMQVTFYLFALSFSYSLFRLYSGKNNRTTTLFTLLIYPLSIGIAGVQILPSIEAFFNSPRGIVDASYLFDTYLLPLTHLVNLFAPDIFGNPGTYNYFGRGFYRETIFFIGMIPAIFALTAFWHRKKDPRITFFLIAALLTFLLTLQFPFTNALFSLPLPLLPTFLPSRILILTAFCLSVLSAFGFSFWSGEKKGKILPIVGTVILLLILFLIYGVILTTFTLANFEQINSYVIRNAPPLKAEEIPVMLKNLLFPIAMTFALGVLIKLPWKNLSIVLIIIASLLGQLYFLQKYAVIGDKEFLYPPHPTLTYLQKQKNYQRFLSFGEPIHENTSTVFGLYSVEGVNPVFPQRFGQLLYAAFNNGVITNNIPRVEAKLSDIGDEESLQANKRRLKLMSILGVESVLYYRKPDINIPLEEKFPQDLFQKTWQYKNWHGFSYNHALPRAFLVDSFRIERNKQKTFDIMFSESFDPTKEVVLENRPIGAALSKNQKTDSTVKIVRYLPNSVELTVKTNKPQLLVLSDNYYPGWQATIDGDKTEIYRTNFTFRSVVVPEGTHTIRFAYEPFSFKLGVFMSIASIIVSSIFFIYLRRRNT